MLRVHQWLKNLLLFVPLFAAHLWASMETWVVLLAAFFSFSLCASLVYVVNDLLDLEYDRQHPQKCKRAFASGLLPTKAGLALVPFLLFAAMWMAYCVGTVFLFWLFVYCLLACIYSWRFKQAVLIDCLVLAMLYTLRIIAGAAAVGISLSFWLLAFSVFFFLSLAFVKRYSELESLLSEGKEEVLGRSYNTKDIPLIQIFGITSGYTAVLILALYLNSDAVLKLYRRPEMVWAAVPLCLFWVSWIWMQAHRGQIQEDPFMFAIQDKTSLLVGFLFVCVLIIGTVGWPW